MKEKYQKYFKVLNKYGELMVFAVILITELVILIHMGTRLDKREAVELTFRGTEIPFSFQDESMVQEKEEGYQVAVWEETEESDPWVLDGIALPKGTYLITVKYESLATKYGSVKFRVFDEAYQYFNDKTVLMLNESTEEAMKIWLDESCENLTVSVHYGGYGRLMVEEISIVEDVSARCAGVLKLAGFFVLLDAALLLIFSQKLLPASYGTRKAAAMLTAITVFACLPLFYDKLYTGHDIFFHMGRIRGIADGLKNGQFPVRIYTNANNGYGYACSLFYGEVLLYIPALLVNAGIPLQKAYQVYAVGVTAGTCWITYLCFGRMFRSRKAGVLAALLYTCSAYRLINVYIRAAVGEYTAMMFLPMLAYAMWTMFSANATKRQKCYGWLWLTAGMTGIIQSHMLTTEMAVLFLAFACLLGIRSFCKVQNFLTVGKAVIATLLLNLWFLVPFLEYYKGKYNVNSGDLYDLKSSGLYLSQIFSLFIGNTGINVEYGMEGEMSLMLGGALALSLILFLCLRAEVKRRQRTEPVDGEVSGLCRGGAIVCLLGCLALWMTSVYFPWEIFTEGNGELAFLAGAIQFPWRYLTAATILFTVLALCVLALSEKLYCRPAGVCTALLFGLLTVLPAGLFLEEVSGENYATTDYYAVLKDTALFDDLYLPADTDTGMFQEAKIVRQAGIVMEESEREDGNIRLSVKNRSGYDKWMELPLVYYPNYRAVDTDTGEELVLEETEEHTIRLIVPAGYEGCIETGFYVPKGWRAAQAVSLVSLILICAAAAAQYFLNKKRREKKTVFPAEEITYCQ